MENIDRTIIRLLAPMTGSGRTCLMTALLLICCLSPLHASPRDFDQAKAIAAKKAASLGTTLSDGSIAQARAKAMERQKADGKTTDAYYIFNFDDNTGYAVVSGEDRMPAIVGYGSKGSIDEDNMPVQLRYLLQAYSATVEAVRHNNPAAVRIAEAAMARTAGSVKPVKALLGNIQWGQSTPFNNLCPLYNDEDKAATGCVATSISQIMKYYNYPNALLADIEAYEVSYNDKCEPLRPEQDPQPVAYTKTYGGVEKGVVYDWDNMLDSYRGEYTEAQGDAVATLMLHAGLAVKMHYGDSSGAYTEETADALVNQFGYDKELVQMLKRKLFEWDEWNAILQRELYEGRPMYYAGYEQLGLDSGHAFLCDGVDADGYYHINWGWSGLADDYFDITMLYFAEPGAGSTTDGFNWGNEIIIGITPDNGVVDEPLVTLDKLALDSAKVTFTKTQRSDVSDTFTGSIIASFQNPTSTSHAALLAYAMRNDDGSYRQITEQQQVELEKGSTRDVTFAFDYAFPNGIYDLYVIESTDQGGTWQLCYGNLDNRIVMKVTDQTVMLPTDVPTDTIVIGGLKYVLSPMTFSAKLIPNDYEGDIVIPESITHKGMTYPVTTIGQNCFQECELTSIKIPETVTTIDYQGFDGCTLTEIDLPNSLTKMGKWCFSACTSLKRVKLPETIEALPGYCFYRCSELEELDIPSTVTAVGDGCFSSSGLKRVTLPDGITKLPSYCFFICSNLEEVSIPSSVTSLGDMCFAYCDSLKTIDLNENITSIGTMCFSKCGAMKTLVCRMATPPAVDDNFITRTWSDDEGSHEDFASDCVLYVPAESVEAYKAAAVWKNFKTILPIDATGIEGAAIGGLSIDASGTSLTFSGLEDGTPVQVYSLNGKLIGQGTVSSGKVTISTSELLVVVKTGNRAIKIATEK